ncbi:putative membrane protein [Paenibacillus harenae]|nr:putative membrane protein [Paenibacillus harenae]
MFTFFTKSFYKWLLAFIWILLVLTFREFYNIPDFLESVLICIGLFLILYLFEKSDDKKPQ